jgi:hypothetical protein
LNLDFFTLEIYGIPGPVGLAPRTYDFQVRVWTSSLNRIETLDLSITINPWPSVVTIRCPDGIVGEPYIEDLQVHGGTSPVYWSIFSGALPAGLQMDPLTGVISGMPDSLAEVTASDFTVEVVDANGASSLAPLSIMVHPTGSSICLNPPLPPSGSPHLLLGTMEGATLLFWEVVSGATGYDILRGDVDMLRNSGGDLGSSTIGCVDTNRSTTSMLFEGTPPVGNAFWFLLRPVNCGGAGTYDSGGTGQYASRDTTLLGACP